MTAEWGDLARHAEDARAGRWVSCAKDVQQTVATHRHWLPSGTPTTVCGSTGLGAGVWRGNSTKPVCPECEANR